MFGKLRTKEEKLIHCKDKDNNTEENERNLKDIQLVMGDRKMVTKEQKKTPSEEV